jgi:general secretion pathway protein L
VAAAADLMRVMSFEIDRYTPFSADQVHFATRVTQRTADRVSVRLVVVDRERLMQIIEDCREAGLILQAIDALDAHDDAMGVDLLPSSLRPAPSRTAHTRRVLLLTCAVLTVALMLSLLDRRQTQVERMSQAVAQQRQQITELDASRRELTDTQGASGYLARLKTSRPTLTVLLTELSHCLGDDTWLEQLEVRESGDVSMSGQSPQASALINRVRDCHSLQNARFQGVIQPDPQSGKDRFSLSAQLRQEASDVPSR